MRPKKAAGVYGLGYTLYSKMVRRKVKCYPLKTPQFHSAMKWINVSRATIIWYLLGTLVTAVAATTATTFPDKHPSPYSKKVYRECYPLQAGALVKFTPKSEEPPSILFFHLTDALFTSIPIPFLPMSPWGTDWLPLWHHPRIQGKKMLEICTEDMVRADYCQVKGKYIVEEQDCDSELLNMQLASSQVMRIKDPGMWCHYHNGKVDVTFEDMEGSVDDIKWRLLAYCSTFCALTSLVSCARWYGAKDDAYSDLMHVLYYTTGYVFIKFGYHYTRVFGGKTKSIFALLCLFSFILYRRLYGLSILHTRNRDHVSSIVFLCFVILKNVTPVIAPLIEMILCLKLVKNFSKWTSLLEEKNATMAMYLGHRRFLRILMRVVIIPLFLQRTIITSYAFWDSVMFENGFKSPVIQFIVSYSELSVTMLVDGSWWSQLLMLMDNLAWPMFALMVAWYY